MAGKPCGVHLLSSRAEMSLSRTVIYWTRSHVPWTRNRLGNIVTMVLFKQQYMLVKWGGKESLAVASRVMKRNFEVGSMFSPVRARLYYSGWGRRALGSYSWYFSLGSPCHGLDGSSSLCSYCYDSLLNTLFHLRGHLYKTVDFRRHRILACIWSLRLHPDQ
jgi:hypothetical protein